MAARPSVAHARPKSRLDASPIAATSILPIRTRAV